MLSELIEDDSLAVICEPPDSVLEPSGIFELKVLVRKDSEVVLMKAIVELSV